MQSRLFAVCLLLALPLGGLAGCAAIEDRSDYDRHSNSDLREDPRGSGKLLFEATTSGQFPADSATAEAVRMEWLAAWMKRTRNCPEGWEILSREPIDPAEVHVRRHDLRYEIQCTVAGTQPGH